MKRFFAILALIVLSLGLMGSMGVAAQDAESDGLSLVVESIIENVDPEDAAEEHIETVRSRTDGRLDSLPSEDRDRVRSWLEEATGTGSSPDRGDEGNESGGGTQDEQANASQVNPSEVDTLENREMIRFSDATRIVGWEFRDETLLVALQTDRSVGVTISDALAGVGEDGATRVPKTSQHLERGETTTIEMDVTTFNGGSSVGVTVNGRTVRLSTEMNEGSENPFNYFGGESGLFTGMGMSVVMSGLSALWVLKREESGVVKA